MSILVTKHRRTLKLDMVPLRDAILSEVLMEDMLRK